MKLRKETVELGQPKQKGGDEEAGRTPTPADDSRQVGVAAGSSEERRSAEQRVKGKEQAMRWQWMVVLLVAGLLVAGCDTGKKAVPKPPAPVTRATAAAALAAADSAIADLEKALEAKDLEAARAAAWKVGDEVGAVGSFITKKDETARDAQKEGEGPPPLLMEKFVGALNGTAELQQALSPVETDVPKAKAALAEIKKAVDAVRGDLAD